MARSFKLDTILASAFLSELIANKKIRVSNTKVGGTPVYYSPGQEPRLQELGPKLSEKPRKAFELLKEKKVLVDRLCEPWQRVALREIKDFAVPLSTEIEGKEEIVWKWYLTPLEEVEKLVLPLLSKKAEKEEAKPVAEKKAAKQEVIREEKQVTEKAKPAKAVGVNTFYHQLLEFFKAKNVQLLDESIIRKNVEITFTAKIHSNLGTLTYHIKAKNKKKISEADLSLAYSEGQEHKLPTMFVSAGELNKKAEKFLKEKLKGLVFVKI